MTLLPAARESSPEPRGAEPSRADTLIPGCQVENMFDAVAPRYDLLNRVLSLGIDRWWRRQAIRSLALAPGDLLLDVCGGTGDLALGALRLVPRARVLDLDVSAPMLRIAAAKRDAARAGGLELTRGDAQHLPLASGVAVGCVIGFGIRNIPDRAAALAECRRVLCPGGRLAILEFSLPHSTLVRGPYVLYLRHILPRIAALTTPSPRAYSYLAESILDFPPPREIARLIEHVGFVGVRCRALTLGIATLYTARR